MTSLVRIVFSSIVILWGQEIEKVTCSPATTTYAPATTRSSEASGLFGYLRGPQLDGDTIVLTKLKRDKHISKDSSAGCASFRRLAKMDMLAQMHGPPQREKIHRLCVVLTCPHISGTKPCSPNEPQDKQGAPPNPQLRYCNEC